MKVEGGGGEKKKRNEEIEATSRNEEKEEAAAAAAMVERASVFSEINQTAFKTEAERGEGRWGREERRTQGGENKRKEGGERLQPDFQPAGPCDIKYFRRPLSLLSPTHPPPTLSRELPFSRPTALAPPHKTPRGH